jgi:hypothetical protein
MTHPYYQLANGNMISKKRVDDAREIIAQLNDGYKLIVLNDSQLFSSTNADEFEAVYRFYKKYDCSVMEARAAIKFLRGEDITS